MQRADEDLERRAAAAAADEEEAETEAGSAGRRWIPGPGDPEERLDRFLARRLGASRRQVRRLLEAGWVRLGGRVAALPDKGLPLVAGEAVEVAPEGVAGLERLRPEPEGTALSVPVLAAGPGWLAVDKPAGVPVHPLSPGETGCVTNRLVRDHPGLQGVGEGGLRSGVVHRLDVGTSGVLVVATDGTAWRPLREAFRTHRVEKRYRALVEGVPKRCGLVCAELRVARHRPARVEVVGVSASAPARRHPAGASADGARETRLVVRSVTPLGGGAAEVEVSLETGFLHQIRATLAHLGHPLLGDVAYGGSARPGAGRPMLHAESVRIHGAGGLPEVAARAPLPPDHVALRDRLAGEAGGE